MSIFCTNCGQALPDGSKFCLNCGTKVVAQNNKKITTGGNTAKPNEKQEENSSWSDAVQNEDYFGFHSEYYIEPKWRWYGAVGSSRSVYDECITQMGYMRYSKYKDDIYVLSDACGSNGEVIKLNPDNKSKSAFRLPVSQHYDYIAVNRQGYYLYNKQTIALYGFDGHEIYTYNFGQKDDNYLKCIYIYDDTVIYSERKKINSVSNIYCVNMVTKKASLLWSTQKGDDVLCEKLGDAFLKQSENEMPALRKSSNIGKVSCEFLYANGKRVVAGYTCSLLVSGKTENAAYVINVDRSTRQFSVLDCVVDAPSKKLDIDIPMQAFSFDMLNDVMWVKIIGKERKLIKADIQEVSNLKGRCDVDWQLCNLCNSREYYFDGINAYEPENMHVWRIKKNGEKTELNYHVYQTYYFWAFGNIYTVTSQYGGIHWYDNKSYDCSLMSIGGKEIEELEKNAKLLGETTNPLKVVTNSGTTGGSNGGTIGGNGTTSLAEFRQNAANVTGYRDELLAYRKSLANAWDYNAYVGILLGVSGPKHGDQACMNYAIGQGDNGNNTKKTLEAKGLMAIFEKYKGKNVDTSIMLSSVENEIVSAVPAYGVIRENFHRIVK